MECRDIIFFWGYKRQRCCSAFKERLDIDMMWTQRDSNGRLFLLKASIEEENYTIAKIYGPNKDAEAFESYHKLSNVLRTFYDFGYEENITMGGDFNCALNINMDTKMEFKFSCSVFCYKLL